MTTLRMDRKHISFNEGGRYFTLYCRWAPKGIARRMFRLWVGLSGRSYELCIGFGRINFKRRELCYG